MSNSFTNSNDKNKHEQIESKQQHLSKENAVEIWKKFIDLLSQNLKPSEISTWFSVLTPREYENNILTIQVPSKDFYGMIEKI